MNQCAKVFSVKVETFFKGRYNVSIHEILNELVWKREACIETNIVEHTFHFFVGHFTMNDLSSVAVSDFSDHIHSNKKRRKEEMT